MIGYLAAITSMLYFTNSSLFDFFQKFFCGGRVIFGPDVASLFLTTFLIAAPAIAFCVKLYLLIKKNDDLSHEFWFPVVVVGGVLTVLVNTIGI